MRMKTTVFLFFAALLSASILGCSSGQRTPELSKDEQKGNIYLDAGTTALVNSDYTEALRNLLTAEKFLPDSPAVWNNLGLAYYGKNEINKAQNAWERALEIDPKFSDARNNLGAMHLQQNKLKEAEKEFKIVLKDLLYDKIPQTNYNLAIIYLRQGQNLLAEQHLRLAVKENEFYCNAWESLARLKQKEGNTLEALDSWKKSVTGVCYSNPAAHFEIASMYLNAKDAKSTKIKLLEIIEQFPSTQWARKAEAKLQLINETGIQ